MMLSAHIIYTIAALAMNGSVTLGRITDRFGFFALVPPTHVPQPAEVPTGVLTKEQNQLHQALMDSFRAQNQRTEELEATIVARDTTIHDQNIAIRDCVDITIGQNDKIGKQSDVIAEQGSVINQQSGTIANQTGTIARQVQFLEGFKDAHDLHKMAWKREQEAAQGYEELVKMANQA